MKEESTSSPFLPLRFSPPFAAATTVQPPSPSCIPRSFAMSYWMRSTVTHAQLEELVARGLLRPLTVV